MTKKEDGFTSLEFLIVLLFLLVFSLGVMYVVNISELRLKKAYNYSKIKTEISNVLEEVLLSLKNDKTYYASSKIDEFYSWNEKNREGVLISIKSLSSKINPNFELNSIYEKSSLIGLFSNNRTPLELQQYRIDTGFIFSKEQMKLFFQEEYYDKYFSTYNWININTCDEFSMKKLVSSLTDSESFAESFYSKIRELRKNKQIIQNQEELKLLAGIQYEKISKYITVYPIMNVHFVEPFILENILKNPDFNISFYQDKLQQLITLREYTELTQENLSIILGIDKTSRLYYYLGVITWFWEIQLEKKGIVCKIIVCRLPSQDKDEIPKLYIVEEKWN